VRTGTFARFTIVESAYFASKSGFDIPVALATKPEDGVHKRRCVKTAFSPCAGAGS